MSETRKTKVPCPFCVVPKGRIFTTCEDCGGSGVVCSECLSTWCKCPKESVKEILKEVEEYPVCQFCLEPADHKCGVSAVGGKIMHSCGDCCGNMGELVSENNRLYDWVWAIIRKHNEKEKV